MLNQLQFDLGDERAEHPTPPTPSGEYGINVPALTAQSYQRTGRFPEMVSKGTEREARKQLNRKRVLSPNVTRDFGHEMEHPAPLASSMRAHWDAPWLPATFNEHEWRKFGRTEEVPYNDIQAGQPHIAGARVQELQVLPGSGTDVRFSGSLRELPHAVKEKGTPMYPEQHTLYQGHHRVAADMTKRQPEMLHQMRVVDAPKTLGDESLMKSDLAEYRVERAARMGVARRHVLERGEQFEF